MPETKYFEYELTLSPRSSPAGTKFPAKLAYWALGNPSHPAVLMPTCFGGTLESTLPFLYKDATSAIPPADYYMIIAGLLGGSESSSPENAPPPYAGADFPHVTYEDNIRLQHALTESLGVRKLHAYIGFSMGGQQAYHAAALFPEWVERMSCIAGSARTSWHNWSFLEGPKTALMSSVDFHGGRYTEPVAIGTRAFSRVYSTWALCQAWFRERQWETLGFGSLEAFLGERWNGGKDANGLLCLTWTWQHGDVTVYHPEDGGDLGKALGRIRAKCLVMPSRTDQYFPPEDSVEEVKHLRDGKLEVIETIWGHVAGGGGGTKGDCEFMSEKIGELMKA